MSGANRKIFEQISVAIINYDVYRNILCVWKYPGILDTVERTAISHLNNTHEDRSCLFSYFRLKKDWVYVIKPNELENIRKDLTFESIIVCSDIFNPEKYYSLLRVFQSQYFIHNDPTKILEAYLTIYVSGSFLNEKFSFNSLSFDDQNLSFTNNNLKQIISDFGLESVLLWNAMILKKRICVFSSSIQDILTTVRTIPLLIQHRSEVVSLMSPLVTLQDTEIIKELESTASYVVGTNDINLIQRKDLYDVLLHWNEKTLTISSESAEIELKMGSIHKEMAEIMISSNTSTDPTTSTQAAITKKTLEILQLIASLKSGASLTAEDIRRAVANESKQRWLMKVATIEGLLTG